MIKKHKPGLLAAAAALLVISAAPAMAIGRGAGHADAQMQNHLSAAAHATASQSQAAIHQADAKNVMSAGRLRACQNRQQAVTNIMARIADRGQKQLNLFTTIATRVENFYTTKGSTLGSYDTLVAAVNTQQAAAQTAVDAVKASGSGFSCDSGDPKAFVTTFKSSLKSEISALQSYRTSVKNLIVGVKSVQSTATQDSSTNASDQTPGGNQ